MKTIVVRHKKTGDIQTFKRVYDTRCLLNCITGEESYFVLVFSNALELKLDLRLWEIAIESGEPEELPYPDHSDSFLDQFQILFRLAHSLKDADLAALAELLHYDYYQLDCDIDFFLNYADLPISSDDLPF